MRVFPIDVEIELVVGARNFDEAREVVLDGLRAGRYADNAKICFNASAVDANGRIKQYAHGDELKKAKRRNRK